MLRELLQDSLQEWEEKGMYFQSLLKVRFQSFKYFPQEKADFLFKRPEWMLTLAKASILDSFT